MHLLVGKEMTVHHKLWGSSKLFAVLVCWVWVWTSHFASYQFVKRQHQIPWFRHWCCACK